MAPSASVSRQVSAEKPVIMAQHPQSAMILGQQPPDLILRAEIPLLGIKKAIKVPKDASLDYVLEQIRTKINNLPRDFISAARLYKPDQIDSGQSILESSGSNVPLPPGTWLDTRDGMTVGELFTDHDVVQVRNDSFSSVSRKSSDDGTVSHLLADAKKVSTSTKKFLGKMVHSKKERKGSKSKNGPIKFDTFEMGFMPVGSGLKSFGVVLEKVPKINGIPIVVYRIIEYIRRHDMETEGIFRLSGSSSLMNSLREQFDNSAEEVDLDLIGPGEGHALACVLKQFLRQMPDPLLTHALYDAWVGVLDTPNLLLRQMYFYHLVHMLPLDHYELLKFLCEFFHELAQYGDKNKMSFQNLATVLGPNMIRQKDESASLLAAYAGAVNSIALELIKNCHMFFLSRSEFVEKYCPQYDLKFIGVARSLYSFAPNSVSSNTLSASVELIFDVGDVLFVTETGDGGFSEPGWWTADLVGAKASERKTGLAPSNYLELIYEAPVSPPPAENPFEIEDVVVPEEKQQQEPLEHQKSVEVQTEKDEVAELKKENMRLLKEIDELKAKVHMLENQMRRKSALFIDTSGHVVRASPPSSPRGSPTIPAADHSPLKTFISSPANSADLPPSPKHVPISTYPAVTTLPSRPVSLRPISTMITSQPTVSLSATNATSSSKKRRPAPAPPAIIQKTGSAFLDEFLAKRIQTQRQLLDTQISWSPSIELLARIIEVQDLSVPPLSATSSTSSANSREFRQSHHEALQKRLSKMYTADFGNVSQ